MNNEEDVNFQINLDAVKKHLINSDEIEKEKILSSLDLSRDVNKNAISDWAETVGYLVHVFSPFILILFSFYVSDPELRIGAFSSGLGLLGTARLERKQKNV